MRQKLFLSTEAGLCLFFGKVTDYRRQEDYMLAEEEHLHTLHPVYIHLHQASSV